MYGTLKGPRLVEARRLSPGQRAAALSCEHFDNAGNTILFVSERRLSFDIRPASKSAQRFSNALLSLFRAWMDAADDPHLLADV
eukprot:6187526-Pleurochrysis_carterae.AAC.1